MYARLLCRMANAPKLTLDSNPAHCFTLYTEPTQLQEYAVELLDVNPRKSVPMNLTDFFYQAVTIQIIGPEDYEVQANSLGKNERKRTYMNVETTDNKDDEIRIMLENDGKALGGVYMAWHELGENSTLNEISEMKGIPYGTTVSNFQIIKQLLQIGGPPTTTSQCRSIAKEIRRFKNRSTQEVSDHTSSKIDVIINDLLAKSEDPNLIAKENRENIQKDNIFSRKSGIYVYTYPHYRKHPEIESTDDTAERYHLKVGKTARSAKRRVSEQTAGMPEDPVPILLITGKEEKEFKDHPDLLEKVEKSIHEHLAIIGHAKLGNTGGGKEWFLTNKETIESMAKLMGLKIRDTDDESETNFQ